jgi:nitrite reductase/ring-hydroxylating ferredoxin subunit
VEADLPARRGATLNRDDDQGDARPPPGTVLCRRDAIADPGGRGFEFGGGAHRYAMFVVRRGEAVYGYVNVCPHARTPLDWTPDQFLTQDRSAIMCATHGARFRIEDGACTAGPCPGKSLTAVAVRVIDGNVVIA